LISLLGLDLAGQSGLLVYKYRANELTSRFELPYIYLATEETAQMAENDENRHLKDFAAPKIIKIQFDYMVSNVAVKNFELKPALLNTLSTHVQRLKLMVLNVRPLILEFFLFL
jgi:hypothetical protein